MTQEELKKRTQLFALRIINLVESLPKTTAASVIGRQLLRSGTSVGANYRASCRSRSTGEFSSKLNIVEKEAGESIYWIELLTEAGIVNARLLESLIDEASQILSIIVASIKAFKQKRNPKSQIGI